MSDIFSEDELTAATEAAAPAPEEQQATEGQDQQQDQTAPARDERGRFAPKEGGDQAAAAEEKPRMVDYGALKEAREKGKVWKSEAETYKQQLDRIREMYQKASAPASAPEIKHDPENDPTGVNYLHQRLNVAETLLAQQTQQQQASQFEQQTRQTLETALVASEQEFRAVAPDYDQAIQHLINMRVQELHLHGLAPSQINGIVSQEALDLAASAVERGMSPAELAYQTARFRGYVPQQAQQQQTEQQQAPQQSPAAQMVAQIQKAQTASKSLGAASGAAPPADVNAQTLAGMTDAEFDKIYRTPEGKRLFEQMFS